MALHKLTQALKKKACKTCGNTGYQLIVVRGEEDFRVLKCQTCSRAVVIEDDIEAQVRMMQAVSLTRKSL